MATELFYALINPGVVNRRCNGVAVCGCVSYTTNNIQKLTNWIGGCGRTIPRDKFVPNKRPTSYIKGRDIIERNNCRGGT